VTIWTALLAAAGPIGASLFTETITMNAATPRTAVVQWSVVLCLAPLLLIYVPLALSVPGPNYWKTVKWLCGLVVRAANWLPRWVIQEWCTLREEYRLIAEWGTEPARSIRTEPAKDS
jgi:hypothetical protein